MIFLLGYQGFVGTGIYDYLINHKFKVQGIGRKNYRQFVGKKCRIFVNANGNSSKRLAENNFSREFDLSVKSVLQTFQDFHYSKYIYLSTVDVYHRLNNFRTTDETTQIDLNKIGHYAFHKYIAEQIVRHYNKNWLIFRLGGMIGKNMKKGAIYDILNEQRLWVSSQSNFLSLDTQKIGEAVIKLSNVKNKIFNLVSSQPINLKTAARIAGKKISREGSTKLIFKVNSKRIFHYLGLPTSKECLLRYLKISKPN